MIDHGSIELLQETDEGVESSGVTFSPDHHFDETRVAQSVARIAGVTLGAALENPYPPENCLGIWDATDAHGQPIRAIVWIADSEV